MGVGLLHRIKHLASLLKGREVKHAFDYARFEVFPPLSVEIKASIIMATADISSDMATKCIKTIKQRTKDYELIILDNNHNMDFNHSEEVNRGLRVAKGKHIVLIDDDVLVSEGWFEALIKCAERNEKIGIVGARITYPDGTIGHTGGYFLPNGGCGHLTDDIDDERKVQFVTSAVMLIKRRLIEQSGLFDEDYHKYYQDADYCIRAWQSNFEVWYTPDCKIIHLSGVTAFNRPDVYNVIERDTNTFMEKWVKTGKLAEVFR